MVSQVHLLSVWIHEDAQTRCRGFDELWSMSYDPELQSDWYYEATLFKKRA